MSIPLPPLPPAQYKWSQPDSGAPAQAFAQYMTALDAILRGIIAGGGSSGTARPQRSITSGPVTISSTDQILNINIASPTSITLPLASSRSGVPLTFIDVGGNAAANNITLNGSGGDLIDGFASVGLSSNYQSLTLNPFNDGVNTGWFVT